MSEWKEVGEFKFIVSKMPSGLHIITCSAPKKYHGLLVASKSMKVALAGIPKALADLDKAMKASRAKDSK